MSDETPSVRLDALATKRDAASSFRDGLRDARSEVLADAEGFMAVVVAIERLGKWLAPKADNLGRYEHGLRLLVERTGVADVPSFARDLCVLRESRNDTAHGGAAARHVADEALRVSMVLEEALTVLHTSWEDVTAEHVMTRNPVVAEPWQLVEDVRRVMLTRGFTALPFRDNTDGPWRVITDEGLVAWLNRSSSDGQAGRHARRRLEVGGAVASGLRADEPVVVEPGADVRDLADMRGLRLVTKDGSATGHLLGVIAPADLL